MTMLLISRGLVTVPAVCHLIPILHDGEIVETGHVPQLMSSPRRPYMKCLVEAIHLRFPRP
jgi:ABC-type dipeptide/oligopeptide/nickel transport system ATPase component